MDKLNSLESVLEELTSEYKNIVFSTSLSIEDMVLTDLIERKKLPISVFTLDTGRLHKETYALMQTVKEQFKIKFEVFYPEAKDLESFVNSNGCNAFYQSTDYRKLCCNIRKVGPLRRALSGNDLWITGLRRSQSVTRTGLALMDYDKQFGIMKSNPLIDWTTDDVWSYIRANDVPYSALYDQGFQSIGCAPCTRQVLPGEEERAVRWWWEEPTTKECGLHISKPPQPAMNL